MRAQIIKDYIYEGVLAWSHGMGKSIYRILLPDLNNISIYREDENLYIWENFDAANTSVVREFEIPDEQNIEEHLINYLREKEFIIALYETLVEPENEEKESIRPHR